MINDKSVYALIPARGGSKRLPEKSILPLCGKPLIVYTIEQALASAYIDRVIVSTDCEKIAGVARAHGAELPFMRPAELATDEATSESVITHALEFFRDKEFRLPDILILLQLTSPLRELSDIDKSLETLAKSTSKSIVSVFKADKSPLWYKTIDEKGCLRPFLDQVNCLDGSHNNTNVYLLNGALYAFYSQEFLRKKVIIGEDTLAYVMPPEKSIDIDRKIDFKLAELFLKGT